MLDQYKIQLILPEIYYSILTFYNDRGIIEEAIKLKAFSNK